MKNRSLSGIVSLWNEPTGVHFMILSLPMVLALGTSGVFAGILGALLGLGGGLIIVPILVLGFGIDIKIAVATSLIAVVASSTAAGSVYVGKGLANMRLGMALEVSTTLGGIAGGLISVFISPTILSGIFSGLMVMIALLTLRAREPANRVPARQVGSEFVKDSEVVDLGGHEEKGKFSGSFFDPSLRTVMHYDVVRLPLGSAVSFFAGIMSGMLGVGGGVLKVPAMNLGMKVPLKVATATSNFMIGVTAISSFFVYFERGFVVPMLAAPITLGVVAGAFYGTLLTQKISAGVLRKIFAVVLVVVAVQMFLKAIGVSVGH